MLLRTLIPLALPLVFASAAVAQPSPLIAVEGQFGRAAFLDESPVPHSVFGGTIRLAVTPRLRAGPEVVYMIGPGEDRDLFVTGNLWFDVLGPGAGGPRRLTPYLLAGAGLMRHTNRFATRFTAHEGAVTAGLGVRIRLKKRWYVAPEARVGWEPHGRLSAGVGYEWQATSGQIERTHTPGRVLGFPQ